MRKLFLINDASRSTKQCRPPELKNKDVDSRKPRRRARVSACYLSGKQSVSVELLHVGHQVVLGVDHILDKHAVEEEPVGPPVHRDPLGDPSVAQPPHVSVALEKQAIQTLLTDKPDKQKHIITEDTFN